MKITKLMNMDVYDYSDEYEIVEPNKAVENTLMEEIANGDIEIEYVQ